VIIIGRDRTGPKGKAHILSTPSVRWAFRCPGHMSFVFLEGSHPISSNTPWLSYRCFHGRIPLKSDDLWRSHKICEHFWTKNPRGPPIGSTKAPPLVAAWHPQLHSLRPHERLRGASALALRRDRHGGAGAEHGRVSGFRKNSVRQIIDVNHGKMDENYGKIHDL
jgi:hypothetical protein